MFCLCCSTPHCPLLYTAPSPYHITSSFSSFQPDSSISTTTTTLSQHLSHRTDNKKKEKENANECLQCVLDWNQYPDLRLVVRHGHEKPELSLWQRAWLSRVLTFWKGIPRSRLKFNGTKESVTGFAKAPESADRTSQSVWLGAIWCGHAGREGGGGYQAGQQCAQKLCSGLCCRSVQCWAARMWWLLWSSLEWTPCLLLHY